MKRPAQSFKKSLGAGVLLLATLLFAGPSRAGKKPKFVYVNGAGISAYTVDSTTGALTPVPGSPFGTYGAWMAVDPSNKFVYVANGPSDAVSAYRVDATTGALTQVSGSPFLLGDPSFFDVLDPISVVVDPSGRFVYVADNDLGGISAFTIDETTGALSPVPGSPFTAATWDNHSDVQPSSLAVEPSGKFLYVANFLVGPGFVSGYKIDSNTGALTFVTAAPPEGGEPVQVAVDPSGQFVYAANQHFTSGSSISAYKLDPSTGALTEVSGSPFLLENDPTSLAFDPLGKFAYVATTNAPGGQIGPTLSPSSSNISGFTVDSTTGVLTPIGLTALPAGTYPASVAVDPSGKFAYVTLYGCNGSLAGPSCIAAYAIDPTNGTLAPIPGSPFATGAFPNNLAFVSSSTLPFKDFRAQAWIDEYSRTFFYVEGFFRLGDGSDGIDLEKDDVEFQLGPLSVTVPAGSFQKRWNGYEFDGRIDGTDLDFEILESEGQFFFGVDGRATISTWFQNPVTVDLTIGANEGSKRVTADIDK